MSYILDALRQAEAQRRQGQTPVLEQVAATPAAPPGGAAAPPGRRAWIVLALLLVAAAWVVGGWWGRRASAPPGAASAPATLSTPATPAALPTSAAPAAPVASPSTPIAGPATRAPAAQGPSAPTPSAGRARAAAASGAAPALAARALPEPRRSELARLPLGGAVQSQDRRQSFVLLAGQIVREGAVLAPGIVLERIGARALRLRVDGQAVELPL